MIEIKRSVSLSDPMAVESMHGTAFMAEHAAHKFIISCYRDGVHEALTGTITAKFLKADGNTIDLPSQDFPNLTGIDENGDAFVILHQLCYQTAGRFQLAIYNVHTTDSTVCIYACVGSVQRTTNGSETVPGTTVPDYSTMTGVIEECEEAAADARTAAQTAVTYAAQSGHSDIEKAQARSNIDAAGTDDLVTISTGLRLTGTAEGNPVAVPDGAANVPCKVEVEISESASEAVITRTGINVFDGEVESGSINVTTGAETNDDNTYRSKHFIPVIAGETYFVRNSAYAESNSRSIRVYFYDKDKVFLGSPGVSGAYVSRATVMDGFERPVAFIRFIVGTPFANADGTISVNYPHTITGYVPYAGRQEVTVDLADIAGAAVSDGTLTLGEDGNGTLVTGGNTYAFEHEVVTTVLGGNTVHCDAGDITLTYAKDVGMGINDSLAEAGAIEDEIIPGTFGYALLDVSVETAMHWPMDVVTGLPQITASPETPTQMYRHALIDVSDQVGDMYRIDCVGGGSKSPGVMILSEDGTIMMSYSVTTPRLQTVLTIPKGAKWLYLARTLSPGNIFKDNRFFHLTASQRVAAVQATVSDAEVVEAIAAKNTINASWTQGYINTAGSTVASAYCIRTDYVLVPMDAILRVTPETGYGFALRFFTEATRESMTGRYPEQIAVAKAMIPLKGGTYFRALMCHTDGSEITPSEADGVTFEFLTGVPNAPTTDGTYTLQAVVSSGNATFGWVAGGSLMSAPLMMSMGNPNTEEETSEEETAEEAEDTTEEE